jgi:replicative DNA helicase
LEAEQAVLGCAIIEKPALEKMTEQLRPGDFYHDAHRAIFEALVSIHERNSPADIITLQEELRDRDQLEQVGGSPYFFQLTDATPTAANVDAYIKIVREKAILRSIIQKSDTVRAIAYSENAFEHISGLNGELNLREPIDERDAGSNQRLRQYQVAAFLKHVGDPPEKIVSEILPDKQLTLWAGKPKAGKSLFVLDMCHAIALGRPVFNKYEVMRKGPVLIVDMENPVHEIANRILKRGINTGTEDLPIHMVSANFRLDGSGMAALRNLAKEVDPVLVVIDSAREALGITDWNDAANVVDRVRPVRLFAQKVCAVLLIAHNRKTESVDAGDEISGSNAFTGAVDGWLSVRKAVFHKDKRLTHYYEARGRGMLTEFVAEMNPDDLHVRALSPEEIAADKRKQQLEFARSSLKEHIAQIVEALKESSQMTPAEIADGTGLDERIVRRRLDFMIQEGIVRVPLLVHKPGAGRPGRLFELISDNHSSYIDSTLSEINRDPFEDDPEGEF